MKNTGVLLIIAVLSTFSALAAAQPSECATRQCLIDLTDDYLQALADNAPERMPFAGEVRFVENIVNRSPGEGLWETATAAPDSFRIYVPDPVSRQVGFLGVMEASGEPILLALRLQLAGGEVIAAEHLIARDLSEEQMANLQSPRPALLATVPESERMPREQLLRIGYSYYDAVDLNNGSLAPFASDCLRRENGIQTTSNPEPEDGESSGFSVFGTMGCGEQLDTGVMSYIDSIDNRRVTIADPVTGLVFGFSHFRHSMEEREIDITGVPGVDSREVNFDPFDLPAAHIFKVTDGMIHEIEAMGFQAPYASPTAWEGVREG